ncbi:MAG: hypothetical protein AB1498_07290 [bacterium]
MKNDIENFLCSLIEEEGIGSIYERFMLKAFFEKLGTRYPFKNVLEYGCKITKGYDNLSFMNDKTVTVADANIDLVKERWKFPSRPEFSGLDIAQKYDLVWNFALIQQHPQMLSKMKDLSRKFIMIFTPNIYNCGTPFHWSYHFITRTPCNHAEQGSKTLRTLNGLKKLLLQNGLKIVEYGYIDMPPIPDIGFSRAELRRYLGWEKKEKEIKDKPSAEAILGQINKMMIFEKMNLSLCLQSIVAHHNYIIAEI